ncbi:MAG: pantoate--beta-alanine ligase [candidate division Zixibacteria bacterium]|nr:pantoate--beta-alanine ligase [candidate division Zixibacteria bacterium]
MKLIRSIKQMQKISRNLTTQGKKIGLVPTMGFLHDGHLSLIKKALTKSDIVITTIFVNPTQFAPNEDLSKYPRDEKADIKKIKNAGSEIVFIPKVSDIYPDEFQTYVNVEELTKTLEGKSRPAHFRGVTTIVAKLFNITRPDVVVFGMKDYQQAFVLKKMVEDLNYPIKFIIAPTVREKDGLAMSSRNKYFSSAQRTEARCLYYALETAKEMVKAGIVSPVKIEKEMRELIYATCKSAKIDYIAFTDLKSLNPSKKIIKNTICSLAVKVHKVRLIDNMRIS